MKNAIIGFCCLAIPSLALGQVVDSRPCPEPQILNSTETFNVYDLQTLNKAKETCKTKYSVNHCVTRFFKTQELSYRVVCMDKKYIYAPVVNEEKHYD